MQVDWADPEAGGYERRMVATVVPEFTTQLPTRAAEGQGDGEYSDGPDRTFVVQTDGALAAV